MRVRKFARVSNSSSRFSSAGFVLGLSERAINCPQTLSATDHLVFCFPDFPRSVRPRVGPQVRHRRPNDSRAGRTCSLTFKDQLCLLILARSSPLACLLAATRSSRCKFDAADDHGGVELHTHSAQSQQQAHNGNAIRDGNHVNCFTFTFESSSRAVAKLCKFGRTDRWRRLLAGESETLVGKVAADVLERRPSSICFAFSRPAFNCQSRSFPVRGCSRRRRPSVIVAPPPPVQMLARCAPVVH